MVKLRAPKPPIPPAPRREAADSSGKAITDILAAEPPEPDPERLSFPPLKKALPPLPDDADMEEPPSQAPPRKTLPQRRPAREPVRMELTESRDIGPPLFIKIDKYKEVVENLHTLKTFSLSLRDALDALADIEKELQNGLSIAHRALDQFNSLIATIDSQVTRIPASVGGRREPEVEPDELDNYVRGLHDQMEKIKQDLKAVDV